MKNTLVAFIIMVGVSLTSTINAQKIKVLDSSGKKPSWCGTVATGFVITVASSDNMEDAKEKAFAKIKEQIISSVAENIQTSSEYNRSEQMTDNSSSYQESFKTATKTRAADLPFLKGISITKASASYWEKVGEKNSPGTYYYHIKYPFSKDQLRKLVLEYEKADKKQTAELNALVNKIPTLESVEEMSQTVKALTAKAESFIDVDPRRNEANVAIAEIKDIMKNVSIETVSETTGEIKVSLRVGDRQVTTTRKPSVKSNCAKITSIKNSGKEWVITYTYDECYEDPDNSVKVTFRNAYGKTTNEYFFNVNAEKIAIFVNNDINFTGEGNCHISITSKYESAFVIEKVILNFGGEAPLIVDNINKTFEGKGNHDLDILLSDINKEVHSAKKYPMIKGTIHYKSAKSGEKSVYKMFNQNITTSW